MNPLSKKDITFKNLKSLMKFIACNLKKIFIGRNAVHVRKRAQKI